LHGWFVPGDRGVTWLWFHGNAGNISHRLENLALLHENLGFSVFLFDYRGYGKSQGKPTEKGVYLDAEAALDYLYSRKDVNRQSIVYFGRSLGTAVAVEMAARHPPDGLILESAFPSISFMARRLYPFCRYGLFSVQDTTRSPESNT
jgi:pimeloyl-ACP methyl ester carboxylesterase